MRSQRDCGVRIAGASIWNRRVESTHDPRGKVRLIAMAGRACLAIGVRDGCVRERKGRHGSALDHFENKSGASLTTTRVDSSTIGPRHRALARHGINTSEEIDPSSNHLGSQSHLHDDNDNGFFFLLLSALVYEYGKSRADLIDCDDLRFDPPFNQIDPLQSNNRIHNLPVCFNLQTRLYKNHK